MKKTLLKSFVSLNALLVLSFAPAALAGPGPERLTGVWDSQVTLTDCNGNTLVSFEAYEMFHAGGTLTSTDNTPPGRQGPGFGTWTRMMGHRTLFRALPVLQLQRGWQFCWGPENHTDDCHRG